MQAPNAKANPRLGYNAEECFDSSGLSPTKEQEQPQAEGEEVVGTLIS